MTMLFRQICAFLFLIIFSGIFAEAINGATTDLQVQNEDNLQDVQLSITTDSYSVLNGLSQNTVTSVAQDIHGNMWIGTLSGLNKFDGTNFKVYKFKHESNTISFIRNVFFTSNNELLVGTNFGVFSYDESKDEFVKRFHLDESIWSMDEHNGTLFIGTKNELYELDRKSEKLKKIVESKIDLNIKEIKKINDKIYIREYAGSVYRIKNNELIEVTSDSVDIESFEDQLYVSKKEGIYILSETLIKISNKKSSLLAIHNNSLIALTKNNLSNITKNKSLGYTEKLFKDISVFSSTKNHLVIGTYGDGFSIIKDTYLHVKKVRFENKNVWSLSKIGNEFFYSTDDSKIQVLDTKYNKIGSIETSVSGFKHLASIEKKLFFGGLDGLFYIEDNHPKSILNEKIYSLTESLNKKEILAGTALGNIYRINSNQALKVTSLNTEIPILSIMEIKEQILIGTQDGLFNFKENKSTKVFNGMVFSICQINNNIFISSDTGIYSINVQNNKLKNLHSSNSSVYALKCFDNKVIGASVKNIIQLDLKRKTTIIIDSKNGSQPEYNASPVLFDNSQNLLFAGSKGITSYNFNFFVEKDFENQIKKPILTELLIFNKKPIKDHFVGNISTTKEIKLKHSEYPFSLHFSTPLSSYNYYYKLEGLSSDWIKSSSFNSATFTNLSSGKYTFKLYANDPLSNINSSVNEINIIITPPWWLSLQAKAVYCLIALLVIYLFIRSINKKRQTQRQIAMSEERLKLSLWGSGDEMWDWDIETGKIYRSNMWESLDFPVVGQRADNENQRSNIHPMDRKRVHQHLEDHLHDKTEHFEISYRVKSKDNQWIWILDRAKVVVRDDDGTPMRMTGTIKNINDLKNTEEQLKLFGKAIENISEGMFILDHSFTFLEVNQACLDITQTTKEDYLGKILKFDQYPDSYSHQIQHMLRNHGRWTNEVDAKRGDGTSFTMDLTIDAIYDDNGNTNHYVAVFSDVSLRKQHEVELQKMSTSDVLTGLPNRSYLQVTLSNLVKRQVSHALMILDIDNFKKINDSLGHNVGDELLQMVTQRIITAVEGGANIYRLGGDEFAILIESTPDIGSAAAMANRVIDTFKSPIEIENTKLVVGASIGIVSYPDDEENEQALLRKAEVAMYSAKSAGGNRYHFYSESQNSNAIRQLEVENLIREGLANDYFEVYYQPKVNVKSNKLAGMEALVRLIHPEQGMISPAEFIPLAEETGLIVELGDIVLQKACRATQKWRLENNFNGRVAVNLSSRQFALPNLQERIQNILEETGLPAESLEIEITESTVIKHPERAIKVMEKLTQMGIHLALDDFGTGYSSLTYLKRFPIHCLKIDKAFIDDIDKSDRDLKMVDSIITIAHNMGLSVVAEGVEEQSQLGILRALKCEEIQGYLFSKPLPTSEFQNQLK